MIPVWAVILIATFSFVAGVWVEFGLCKAFGLTVIGVGDIDDDADSLQVFKEVEKRNPDIVLILGDLTYNHDLTWFLNHYGKLNYMCVDGDHKEKGQDICKDFWSFGDKNVRFIGFNDKADLNEIREKINQSDPAKKTIVFTHHPCAVKIDVKRAPLGLFQLCDDLKSEDTLFLAGHRHLMAYTAGDWGKAIISGAGGAWHEGCRHSFMIWCNDVDFGFVQLTINQTHILPVFHDSEGKVIFEVYKKK